MKNQRFVCSWVLALVLSVTSQLACVRRDWNICAPEDKEPCLPGYVCTPSLLCVRAGDGGSDGLLAVDSQSSTDAIAASTDVVPSAASDGPVNAGPDAAGPSVSADAPVDTVADVPATAGPPDAPVGGVADAPAVDALPGGPTVDAPGPCTADKDCAGRPGTPACTPSGLCVACTANKHCTGLAATCDTTTNQCVGCTKRSDCAGACQTCTNSACTAVKSQDDPGVCAGTCDATGACKSKQGQTCKLATDCAGGIFCADGYCCDKACTGSCEACDVASSPGTCTTLPANATPHTGHTACTATDSACAGTCNGTSAACFYPAATTTCGSASCTGSAYQAAGTCNSGACKMPPVQTCANGNTCQPSSGTCGCSNTTCGSACVVLATDPKNCGSCGHDCLGGTCSGGQCKAAVVASSSGDLYVIGVAGSAAGNVYYQGAGPNAYQVDKTAQNGTGSPLDVGGGSAEYLGIIGSKLFFEMEGSFGMCDFTSADPTHCANGYSNLPGSGDLIPFKSPSPLYMATYNGFATSPTITWYSASGTPVQSFDVHTFGSAGSFFAFGDMVYWIQDETDSTASNPDSAVYSVSASASTPTAKRLTSSIAPSTYTIIDANALSLLLTGPSGLYRVALPDGDAAHAPQWIVAPASSSGSVTTATEDANGIYWFERDGTLYGCSPANCGGTKKARASGQVLVGPTNTAWPGQFYQDSSALYWGNYSTGQVMRLVK
jgi:hypothetical protein